MEKTSRHEDKQVEAGGGERRRDENIRVATLSVDYFPLKNSVTLSAKCQERSPVSGRANRIGRRCDRERPPGTAEIMFDRFHFRSPAPAPLEFSDPARTNPDLVRHSTKEALNYLQ